MKGKFSFILLVLSILLSVTACQSNAEVSPHPEEPPQGVTEPENAAPDVTEPEEEPENPAPDPSLSQRDQDWVEDIEYLREKYKTIHMDPFYVCPEEEFDSRLDQLTAKVSQLSDEDIYYEIKSILAGMGDNHTDIIKLPEALNDSINGRRFPIWAGCFGGKLYLCGYLEGYEQFAPYLLREIVAVNGVDISYLEAKTASIKHPFNSWAGKEWLTIYCCLPSFLDWAGCDYKEGYVFQILNENQEVESVEIPVITLTEYIKGVRVYPENWDRLYYSRDRSANWADYVEGENGGCVYMHFVSMTTSEEITEVFNAVTTLIEAHPDCGKLAIDIRDYPGGPIKTFPMLQTCTEQLGEFSMEQTYVITGGSTASAAITCLGCFQDILDAVVIGEPTAQFVSFFAAYDQYVSQFFLPHSKIWVQVSDGWYDTGAPVEAYYDEDSRLYPWEDTVLPDVYIHQDIEDLRQGKDSVIQWVLEQ